MPKKNNFPPFEDTPDIVCTPMRVEFHIVVFTSGQISPQRIEDAITDTIKTNEAFGFVTDISTTRREEENGT